MQMFSFVSFRVLTINLHSFNVHSFVQCVFIMEPTHQRPQNAEGMPQLMLFEQEMEPLLCYITGDFHRNVNSRNFAKRPQFAISLFHAQLTRVLQSQRKFAIVNISSFKPHNYLNSVLR